jgi:hypothetical protein
LFSFATLLRCTANLLGFCALVAFFALRRELFAGVDQTALFLAAGSLVLWVIAFLTEFSDAPEERKHPLLTLLNIGVPAACLALVLAALPAVVPGLRRTLTLQDHHRARQELYSGYPIFPRFEGGLGFARRQDFYDAELGPTLLKDADVLQRLRGDVVRMATEEGDLHSWRADWVLLYAAMRLQGLSEQDIWNGPEGTRLFLGTLLAELDPPYWWNRADWLRQALELRQEEGFAMGLLRRETVGPQLQRIAAASASAPKPVLSALLSLAVRRPGLLPRQQLDALFDAARERVEAEATLKEHAARAFEGRKALCAFLDESLPGEAVGLDFESEPRWSEEVSSQARELFVALVHGCGVRVEQGKTLAVGFSVEARDELVGWSTQTDSRRREYVQTGYRQVGKTRVPRKEWREVVTVNTFWHDGRRPVPLPVFDVRAGEARLVLVTPPPAESVPDYELELTLRFLRGELRGDRRKEEEASYVQRYVRDTFLQPWRLGVEPLSTYGNGASLEQDASGIPPRLW